MQDYYQHCGIPKPRPRRLEKDERKAKVTAEDTRQRKRCHVRSGGRCEVIFAHFRPEASEIRYVQCRGRALHNHHLMGGNGRRNVGVSILAEHRLDTCSKCHGDIGDGLLKPMLEDDDYRFSAALVRYVRTT